ncbi:MAG: class B sortase [Clostridia bacterium]|nr:class B sortase [Clostridia bacterium]
MSKDNINENKNPSSLPEGLSSIADDEAITEIDLGDFLIENSKSTTLFEGFREDIEKTEKSLESDLQSLYDDIMGSGPETIVPKPISMLTESEAEPKKVVLADPEPLPDDENSSLEDLWMNPDDYFDADIPVVSLDEETDVQEIEVFEPAPEETVKNDDDDAKSSIFSMIDMLKKETDTETGFDDILSEIEANPEIAPVDTELSAAAQLVSALPEAEEGAEEETEEEEELDFSEEDFDWDEMLGDKDAPEFSEELPAIPEPAEEIPEVEEITEDITEETDGEVFDTDSDDFEAELARLLGDDNNTAEESAVEETETEEKKSFVINVPDDGNDYEKAAATPEKLYQSAPMSTTTLKDDPELLGDDYEDDKKDKKKNKKEKKSKETENKTSGGAAEVVRKIILSISIITIVVCLAMLANVYIIEPYRFKSDADKIASEMSQNINTHSDATVNDAQNSTPDIEYPEGMLAKYANLYAANDDLKGWISIPGFEINLPIAQGKDNSYYLKKDIYGKYTRYGVPYFDYRMDNFKTLHRNSVIYGHNMRHDDLIFGMLENYRNISGFRQAPVIECNTIYGDHTWFVYAVFITNADKEDDNGYVFPYNFIDISDRKFEAYIEEIDKRKLYTTGVDIAVTDKILTLSTCAYDFDDARLVVVARERREGESIAVDTSKAYKNNDPKYPQAWYDAYGKDNTHANEPRW